MGPLDDLLSEIACRALVVVARSAGDPHLAPFAGPVKLGDSVLVAPRGAAPRLGFLVPMDRDGAAASGLRLLTPEQLDVARWARDGAGPAELLAGVVSRALQLCEVAPGAIALAGYRSAGETHDACRRLAAEGWSVVPGEGVVRRLRKRKTRRQLERVRAAAEGAMAALREVARLLAASVPRGGELHAEGAPLTVGRLKRRIARVLFEHGLEQPEGGIVAPAEEGAVPHASGTAQRVLVPGQSLVVDVYPRGELFADCTRTFCVGEQPPALAAAHAAVVEALGVAYRRALPGARGWSLQEAVCEHFAAAGYPTPISDPSTTVGYVHGLGHGLGYELHELPSFREEAEPAEGRLEEGDVFTLEPGLYDPQAGWAVRLEDLVVLGAGGVESLTPLPHDLDPRRW